MFIFGVYTQFLGVFFVRDNINWVDLPNVIEYINLILWKNLTNYVIFQFYKQINMTKKVEIKSYYSKIYCIRRKNEIIYILQNIYSGFMHIQVEVINIFYQKHFCFMISFAQNIFDNWYSYSNVSHHQLCITTGCLFCVCLIRPGWKTHNTRAGYRINRGSINPVKYTGRMIPVLLILIGLTGQCGHRAPSAFSFCFRAHWVRIRLDSFFFF